MQTTLSRVIDRVFIVACGKNCVQTAGCVWRLRAHVLHTLYIRIKGLKSDTTR